MTKKNRNITIIAIGYLILAIVLTLLNHYLVFSIDFMIFTEEQFVNDFINNLWFGLFSALFFSVILFVLINHDEQKEEIKRYHENIDDCRFWFSEEVAYKNGANIRRLSEKGIISFDLSKTMLQNLKLKEHVFDKSKFMGAKLDNCNINKASFTECDFQGASIKLTSGCNSEFLNSSLKNCKLLKSNFKSSCFKNVNFEKADLSGADFSYAKFYNCNFTNTVMNEVNFERADLRNTNGLTKDQLLLVRSLKYVKLESELEKEIYKLNSNLIGFDLEARKRFAGK